MRYLLIVAMLILLSTVTFAIQQEMSYDVTRDNEQGAGNDNTWLFAGVIANRTTTITNISLHVTRDAGATGQLQVSIYNFDSGTQKPTTYLMNFSTIDIATLGVGYDGSNAQWYNVSSPTGLSVTNGDYFAIVLHSPNVAVGNWYWQGKLTGGAYSQNSGLTSNDRATWSTYSGYDFLWRTYSGGASGGGTTGNIMVNFTFPKEGSGLTTANLTNSEGRVYINTTINDTAYCFTNDTRWNNVTNDIINNTQFYNNTFLANGLYSVLVTCNRTLGALSGYNQINFRIDTSSPTITPSWFLLHNQTVVYNGTLVTNINFTDNLELYSINITLANGSNAYLKTNIGKAAYALNISYGVDSTVSNYFDATVCDAHTASSIETIDRIDITKSKITFVTKDKPFLSTDDYVRVYAKDATNYKTATTEKLYDRYSFNFELNAQPKATETFIVESNDYIDIAKGNYCGHLIIPAQKRWVDFNNKVTDKCTVTRITNNKVEVAITGLTGTNLEFNSIGELNCVTQRFWFGNANPTESYINETIGGTSNIFYLNLTYDAITMANMEVIFVYNSTQYNATGNISVNNKTLSATKGTSIAANITFYWVLDVGAMRHNLTNHTQRVSNIIIDNCTTGTYAFLNFSNWYESDVTNQLNSTFEFSGDLYYTNPEVTATFNFSLPSAMNHLVCVSPANATLNINAYLKYYTASGFTHRYYLINDSLTSSQMYEIKTYNFNTTADTSTARVTTRVKSSYDYYREVYAKLQRYYVGENVWRTVQMDKSDEYGLLTFDVIEKSVDYRILFYEATGYLLKQSEVMKFSCDYGVCALTAVLSPYTAASEYNNISVRTSFDNTTNVYSIVWSDPTSYSTSMNLKVVKSTPRGDVTICDVTQSGTAGNYDCNVSSYTGGFIVARVASIRDGERLPELMEGFELGKVKLYNVVGQMDAAFWSFGLMVTIVGFGIFTGAVGAIVSVMFALIAVFFLGIMNGLTIAALVAAGIMAILVALKMRQ